jgi:hypothetical protein
MGLKNQTELTAEYNFEVQDDILLFLFMKGWCGLVCHKRTKPVMDKCLSVVPWCTMLVVQDILLERARSETNHITQITQHSLLVKSLLKTAHHDNPNPSQKNHWPEAFQRHQASRQETHFVFSTEIVGSDCCLVAHDIGNHLLL